MAINVSGGKKHRLHCYTCKKFESPPDLLGWFGYCHHEKERALNLEEIRLHEWLGCASHSDALIERNAVLDAVLAGIDGNVTVQFFLKVKAVVDKYRQKSKTGADDIDLTYKDDDYVGRKPVIEVDKKRWQDEIPETELTPPDYKTCPCWISPIDPDETRGECTAGGDCKPWQFEPYEKCDRFQKGCNDCDEVLCKFRTKRSRRGKRGVSGRVIKYKCTYTPFEGAPCPTMWEHPFPHPSHCHAYDTTIWDINPKMTCKNCIPLKKGENPQKKVWCSEMPDCDSYSSSGDDSCEDCPNVKRYIVFNPGGKDDRR